MLNLWPLSCLSSRGQKDPLLHRSRVSRRCNSATALRQLATLNCNSTLRQLRAPAPAQPSGQLPLQLPDSSPPETPDPETCSSAQNYSSSRSGLRQIAAAAPAPASPHTSSRPNLHLNRLLPASAPAQENSNTALQRHHDLTRTGGTRRARIGAHPASTALQHPIAP